MNTVAILSEKGGAGKTTLSTNLAWSLRARGHHVLLVDADPQGSAVDWFDASEGSAPTTLQLTKRAQLDDLARYAAGYDYVLLDGAPGLGTAAPLIRAAATVLLPCQPSAADIRAAYDLVEVIRARQEAVGRPRAAFVVSRQVAGTRLADSVQDALEGLGLPVLAARTSQRVAYAEALGHGTWAGALDARAAAEIEAITDALLELCHETP